MLLVSLLKIKTIKIGWCHSTFEGYYRTRGRSCYGLLRSCKKSLSSLDYFIVLTKKDQKVFEREFNRKTYCLYNPVGMVSTKITASPEKPIVFCGRLDKKTKGLDFLINIIEIIHSKASKREFVIIGDGPDAEWLKKRISEKNLDKCVRLVGKTDRVQNDYENGSVLIHTSRWEGFGVVLVEAMSF